MLIGIGAGTGLVYLLRWYWWRINAWSEISAMIASFIVSISAINIIKPRFPDGDLRGDAWVMIVTVVVSTIVWLGVTFATKPEPDRVLAALRAGLRSEEYVEVETPVLQPLYGGGSARPFLTHHNELERDQEEVFIVLEGDAVMVVDGEDHPAPAGTCASVPRGSAAGCAVASAEQITAMHRRAGLHVIEGGLGHPQHVRRL